MEEIDRDSDNATVANVSSVNDTGISSEDKDPNSTDFFQGIIILNTVAYSYLMPLFLASGILTNLANIYCLHDLGKTTDRKHRSSTTTYLYLNWLAVAQFLACISVIPSLINLYRDSLSYSWAYYYAHFEIVVINSLTSSCVYIVVGLSFDRFVAVCRPQSYQILKGMRLALIRILACFIVPPIIYTPLCFFQKVEPNEDGTGYIPADNTKVTSMYFWQFWNAGVELCHRFIPATFIVIINLCIIKKFKKVKSSLKNRSKEDTISRRQLSATTSGRNSTEQESKMFILLIWVIIVFLATTLPAACLGVTDSFGHSFASFGFEVFRAVANLLEVLGFSLNFFLYFFLVPEVKAKLVASIQVCSFTKSGGSDA